MKSGLAEKSILQLERAFLEIYPSGNAKTQKKISGLRHQERKPQPFFGQQSKSVSGSAIHTCGLVASREVE